MGPVTIRRACDLEGFGIFHALQLAYEASLPPDLRHPLADVENLPQVYAEPNAAFVASVGGSPAGCIAARRLDPSTNVLQRLYVKPVYRGRGIARALVEAVIALSRTAAYDRVVLDTDRDQLEPAYALYRALGFTQCEPYAPVDYASPTFMELRLR
jgi:GNAT superfamily N-acetyltransferase